MDRKHLLIVAMSITLNGLISWTLLPLVMPSSRTCGCSELGETLLWQGMGLVGWPLAVLGTILAVPIGAHLPSLGSFLIVLAYPAMPALAIRVLTARPFRLLPLVLLHLVLALSFAAVWWHVLNGYNFMVG